jgi:6-pyruvoyltetrahydropterin/6-carboxytetrahydropterin synthase
LQLHGATYTVDVEFKSRQLAPKLNWVVDIGEASDVLGGVLKRYNFKNLDEVFPGENTTTEFMCKVSTRVLVAYPRGIGLQPMSDAPGWLDANVPAQVIQQDLAKHFCKKNFKGSICVKLWESHKAWACYEAEV